MAYLILNENNPANGSDNQKYYEFDPNDPNMVRTIEELLQKRRECPSCAREKIETLFDNAVQPRQKGQKKKITPTSIKKMHFFSFRGKSKGMAGRTIPV